MYLNTRRAAGRLSLMILLGISVVGLAAIACSSADELPSGPPLVPALPETDEPPPATPGLSETPIDVRATTYETSGELVHPDAFVFSHEWNGRRRWFAGTPYPAGNAVFENPSIFITNNGIDWEPPPGLTNPLAVPVGTARLSDPDLSYDPVGKSLLLYFREYGTTDRLFVRRSRDGTNWDPQIELFSGPKNSLISPAVVREEDGSWRMWTVDAGTFGCRAFAENVHLQQRRSRDGMDWGVPKDVHLSLAGWVPWHWDVQYVGAKHEYWALIAAYRTHRDCSETSVFFARSTDGTEWTAAPTALLGPNQVPALRDLVYRSTFRYYPSTDEVTVWYSGGRVENGGFHYALAMAHYRVPEMLQLVSTATSASAASSAPVPRRSLADRKAIVSFIDNFP